MSDAASLPETIDGPLATLATHVQNARTHQELVTEYFELNLPTYGVPIGGLQPHINDCAPHDDIHTRIDRELARLYARLTADRAQDRALIDQESDRSPPRPSSNTMTSSSPTPSHTTTTLETYKSPQRLSSHTMTSSSPTPSRTTTTPETYRSLHRLSSHTMTSSSSPRRASRGVVETITPRSRPFDVRITLDQRDHQARERSQLLRRERQHQRPRSSTLRSSFQKAAINSSTRILFRPVP
jgi:hypothetical protein